MTESIWHVLWVGFVLTLLPQILAYLLGELGHNRGMWWPVVGAVILAPSLYAWAVTVILAPGQPAAAAITIQDPTTGVVAHFVAAILVQYFAFQRVR